MVALPPSMPISAIQQSVGERAALIGKRLVSESPESVGSQQALGKQLAEFASLFIFQMLQAMRQTIPESELIDSGFANDLYHSLMDQEIAKVVARRGSMGLTSLLQQQFTKSDKISQESIPIKHALSSYRQQLPQGFIGPFSMPTEGHLSSYYGNRLDPLQHDTQWHNGIDIAAPAGTLVKAVASGRVLFSGTREGYGNLLILEHLDGYQTYYAHNANHLVEVGTDVRAGQAIAHMGQSGQATGPHLHFEIRKDGVTLDPVPFLTSTDTGTAHK